MNPADLFRASRRKDVDAARDAAAAGYAEIERLALRELCIEDDPKIREVAGLYRRAYTAEDNDPEPRANLRESYCCLPCHVWYTNARQNA